MTRQDRWQLMALALELRLAARAQTTSLLPILPTPRMVEIAEAMESVSARMATSEGSNDRPRGYCAWD